MIKTVIFDLDGTLLNTLDDLADAGNWVCAQNGWPIHTIEEYKRFVGNGLPKLVERFSPPEYRDPAQLEQTLMQFSSRYDAHKEDKTAPYPGILPLLTHLNAAGVQLAVLSNKDDRMAQTVIRHYFGEAIPFVQGRLPGKPAKPHPFGLQNVMSRMEADPSKTLFVGDSDVDILTAHNGSLPAAGVLWGFRDRAELTAAGAEYLVENPKQLELLILGNTA